MKLLTIERAASLLLAKHLGDGFFPCAFYPGATIKNALIKLETLGFICSKSGHVTSEGRAWLQNKHLAIARMP